MRSLFLSIGVICLVVGEAFQVSQRIASIRRRPQESTTTTATTFLSSTGYLSSLSNSEPSSAPVSSTTMESTTTTPPSPPEEVSTSSSTAPPQPPSPQPEETVAATSSPTPATNTVIADAIRLIHASKNDFDISNMTPKGPRPNADVGKPHDKTLRLGQDRNIRAGTWWCAAGGWPSLEQRATTEIFYVLKGQGCLTDLDGMRHYFGPGDVVVLPKGWSGRWDVLEDIHNVWFVHEHPNIEHKTNPIRVEIANYNTFAPQYMTQYGIRKDAIHGSPSAASRTLYEVGPTEVGVWTCTAGSFPVTNRPTTECLHVLEGVFFLTNAVDGTARRCVPGDTVILPKGWSGYWDVIEPLKKLWVIV